MDNEGFEPNWTQGEALLKKKNCLLYFVRNRHSVDQLNTPNFCGFVSVGETQYICTCAEILGRKGGTQLFFKSASHDVQSASKSSLSINRGPL